MSEPLSAAIPLRQYNGYSLSNIPIEIYLGIFNIIKYMEDLSSSEYRRLLSRMSLVCRLFRSIALPRLFETMRFTRAAANDTVVSARKGVAFSRSLVQNEEPACTLALHVKHCKLLSWYPRINWSYETHVKSLVKMQNLVSLHLFSSPITRELLRSIGTIHSIKSLALVLCNFYADITIEDVRGLGSLQLATLRLDSAVPPKFVDDLAQAIASPALTSLTSNQLAFKRRILAQNADIRLEHLKTRSIHFVIESIDRLQFLKHLNISQSELANRIHNVVPLLPLLQTLECPEQFIACFAPGCSIKSIRIVKGNIIPLPSSADRIVAMADVLAAAEKSTVAITKLTIPSDYYSHFPLTRHFPHLEELRIEYASPQNGDNYDYGKDGGLQNDETPHVVSFVGWPVTASLRRLVISFSDTHNPHSILSDLPLQSRVLKSHIVPVFPDMLSMRFTFGVEWRRIPYETEWKPVVLRANRQWLLHWLRGCANIVDYDGCLASAYTSSGLSAPQLRLEV